jgi:hypothetical protein
VLAIVFALVLDFLFLPALLLFGKRDSQTSPAALVEIQPGNA